MDSASEKEQDRFAMEIPLEEADIPSQEEVSSEVSLHNEQNIEEEDVRQIPMNTDAPLQHDISSVQIAPTGTDYLDEDNPMLFIQLGDRVVIDSKRYGRTVGMVYYRSLEMIRVKPDGVSNMLHSFEVEQVDGEEVYKEEDGVTSAIIIEKRIYESFVEQQDFRIGQTIDTFDHDGAPANRYTIKAVDKEKDMITIADIEDAEVTNDILFDFIGIEPDEDFAMISISQFVAPSANLPSDGNNMIQAAEKEEEAEEAAEKEEVEEGIQLIGFIQVTRAKVIREAASHEQRIPDNLQKIDALNDFMSGLDPILQKDPRALRNVRMLVETLFDLKQSTIAYTDSGSIQGPREVSATSLADLIQRTTIPLGRPVLHAIKKLYDSSSNDEEEEEKSSSDETFMLGFLSELKQMMDFNTKQVSSVVVGSKGSVIREWQEQYAFAKEFLSPCILDAKEAPVWNAFSDSEYFRSTAPMSTEQSDGTHKLLKTVEGYLPGQQRSDPGQRSDPKIAPVKDMIPFGLERALSTTYRKGSQQQRKKQVLIPEESSTIDSYIMFPASVAQYLGSTRSRHLTTDSGRSQMPPKTMKTLLEGLGAPKEIGSSKDIILLNVLGDSVGNIPLADYIEGITVPALGLSDVFDTLEQYGMENLELTRDSTQVLLTKIQMYQSQLLSTLGRLRKKNQEQEAVEPTANPLLEHPTILETIRSQPTLAEALTEYERINPSLAASDLGQITYLMRHYPIYFQVAAGQNPVLIAKALMQSNMTTYLDYLRIMNLVRYNEKHAGVKPMKNTCQHVAMLVSIRKISDDSERFQELAKFFRKYQGTRDGNWINCNVCKEHVLCIHEVLQLQAYLNPKEKETLEKEIILKCSGGQFQGKYICRNCGQAIREMDFDNHLEFDDNGKPKSGRAVLVDEDAVLEDKLDLLVNMPMDTTENEDLTLNEDEQKLYNIIREIAERVGIQLDSSGYKRTITNAAAYINKFPNEDVYYKAAKGSAAKVEYQVALARVCIAACAIFLLIEIQTKKPSYVIRYTLMGCKSPGFDGYPLDPTPSNKQGIEYIACAIASIPRNDTPWNQSGFQAIKDDVKRRAGIVFYMEGVLRESISDPVIQTKLAEKRAYLLEVLGTASAVQDGRPKDMIPPTFLPEQIMITPEEAAKDAIRPEVAANMGNRGKMALIKLWIRRSHELAKKTASLSRGNPMMETTCCVESIKQPGAFFKEHIDLPSIGKRALQPYQQGQFMLTEFIPRPLDMGVVSANKDLYYRIFLKCCFQGPRIGYPHEPGLTNRCHWCGFEFPTHPAVMDVDKEGKPAILSQNVVTGSDEFTMLLDTIHMVNQVTPIQVKEITSVTDIMKQFGEVQPAPIAEWSTIIQETTAAFLKLPADADRADIVLAAGAISEAIGASQRIIAERITVRGMKEVMANIAQLSWINFFQVIQTYFITPFQRMVSHYSKDSLFIPIELEKVLSDMHVEKDLMPILQNDVSLLIQKGGDMRLPKYQFARVKLEYYIAQMSALLPYKNSIRSTVVPGRELALQYIQEAIFYGPLATLINSAEIAEGTEIKNPIKSMGDPSIRFLLELIVLTLDKYNREKMSFNDEEIKNLIAIREEKERVNIIKNFDKLTDEEKHIELMNKRLGLGKWAVGGTSKIYKYDAEYYDEEREKRLAAGIVEFPGRDQLDPASGRVVDDLGFHVYTDAEMEADGGYDVNQHGDDDME
jgi:hypothetical protein